MKRSLFSLLLLALTTSAWAQPLLQRDREAVLDASHHAVPPQATVKIERTVGRFTRVRVAMPGSGAATLYLRGGSGHWQVIAGPGTAWTPAEFDRLGIPRALR